jgi:hypothetical protein
MTNGDSESIRCVGLRKFAKTKKGPDHFLDLGLMGSAVSHQRFFYFQGRIFGNGKISV